MVIFPPALYGLGKALAQLHRHFEALEKAKEGLELLPSYHLPVSMHWPGTDEIITEALAQNVEVHVCAFTMYVHVLVSSSAVLYACTVKNFCWKIILPNPHPVSPTPTFTYLHLVSLDYRKYFVE